jgi:hypothetical protein
VVAALISSGLRERFEDRMNIAGELLGFSGQGDHPVRACAQERDPGDGFELAHLEEQGGVLDAEVPGSVLKAGMPGNREDPADALLGARAGEGVPDS